ncbi:Apoptosis-inducing factor 2 [Aphanomyces cochlioides]|nr:Apoptosis-inducing factor 2 [Aphanomyces cochlioides]
MSSPKQIVIIGGGYVGIQFAQELAKQLPASQAKITVIEKNEFTFHAIGVPRAYVDPSYVSKLFIPLNNALPASHSTWVHGIADTIQPRRVLVRRIVDNRIDDFVSSIPYDYLVLAMGSSYTFPIKLPAETFSRRNVENAIVDTANCIKAATSVLVIGGGPVGIEVAGQIAAAYPQTSVTIVEKNTSLVRNAGVSKKFRAKLMKKLYDLNVEVLLGQSIPKSLVENGFGCKTLTTNRGTMIESDVRLVCTGMQPNSHLVKKFDPTLVNSSGAVKVTASMQLDDSRFPNVFAIGDVSDHPSPKLAYTGILQGIHLAKQLATIIKKGTGTVAPFASSGPDVIFIPLGPHSGVGQFPIFGGVVAGDMMVRTIKGNDYYASYAWSMWNARLTK